MPGCAVSGARPSCLDDSPEPPALRGRIFFLPSAQQETGLGRDRTTQRGRSLVIPRVLVRMRMDMAPLSGHTLESGAGPC